MNEEMNMGPSPENVRGLEEIAEEVARGLAVHEDLHPGDKNPRKSLMERGPIVAELEEMITAFESTHSLNKLNEIGDISDDLSKLFKRANELEDPERIEKEIEYYKKYNTSHLPIFEAEMATIRAIVLTPDDQKRFNIRRAAKKDFDIITRKLDSVRGSLEYERLKKKCQKLQKALGNIDNDRNPNKVDHT